MTIGIIAAFLGGVLALLSPCGALLVPAFFAFTTAGAGRLLLRTGIFLLGLLTILLPMGAGAGLIGSLLTEHRSTLILVSGAVLVVLGILQILGIGFDLGARLPGGARAATASACRPGCSAGSAGAPAPLAAVPLSCASGSPPPAPGSPSPAAAGPSLSATAVDCRGAADRTRSDTAATASTDRRAAASAAIESAKARTGPESL